MELSYYLQIIFSAVVALATVAYAALTLFLVRETIRLREAQTEPEIVVYLQPSEHANRAIDIVVKNIGAGSAHNLVWSFDTNAPLIKERGTNLDKMKFFEGVTYFAPAQVFSSFFGTGPDLLREPVPPALKMVLKYENRNKKQYTREFIIDPMQFYGRMWIGGQPMREMAESLKKIEKNIDHMLSGFKRAKVDIYARQDREEERREMEEHWAELTHSQNSQAQDGGK